MLVGQLSESSAFAASCRGGGQYRPWDTATTLAALNANLLAAANHQRRGRRRRFTPPVQVPSPQRRPARVVRIADVKAHREQRGPTN